MSREDVSTPGMPLPSHANSMPAICSSDPVIRLARCPQRSASQPVGSSRTVTKRSPAARIAATAATKTCFCWTHHNTYSPCMTPSTGLGLSIVGLYGLVAYSATRRTREIGIRMAIGATAPTVLRMVLRQGVALAVIGLAIGLAASVGAGALLAAAFPSGKNERDLMALVLVAPVVFAVTLLATYVPARRASRINPMEALRYE